MSEKDEVPYEVSSGFVEFMGTRIRVVYLSNGDRIIPAEEAKRALLALGFYVGDDGDATGCVTDVGKFGS